MECVSFGILRIWRVLVVAVDFKSLLSLGIVLALERSRSRERELIWLVCTHLALLRGAGHVSETDLQRDIIIGFIYR